MQTHAHQVMSVGELLDLMDRDKPDNEDPRRGYALVNVLPAEKYAEEHIPGSTNIPLSRIERFAQQFGPNKSIVVYSASLSCQASLRAAEELVRRGFTRVSDFEQGLAGWKGLGRETAGEKESLGEIT